MAGHDGPPDGTPERAPGGGDDEYRSIVFDEAFVKAARLEEYSARERVGDHTPAVRSRRPQRPGASRQALVLVLLIALAFGTAIYMGVRHPYRQPGNPAAAPLRSSVIPLTPEGPVPGGDPAELIADSPAQDFGTGAAGIELPDDPESTRHFTEEQVVQALTVSKDYLVTSAIDAHTLTGGKVRDVRIRLDPQQHGQFDQSLARPADDGRHAATGWMVRFDPEHVRLAHRNVRVDGAVRYAEVSDQELEVSADHVFVYALRPADASASAAEDASLFTVRRQVRIRFDHDDLRDGHLELAETALTAGPLACTADAAGYLRPLLAGERDPQKAPQGTNPFATPGQLSGSLCGVLDTGQATRPS